MHQIFFSFFPAAAYLIICCATDLKNKTINIKVSLIFLLFGIFDYYLILNGNSKTLLFNLVTPMILIIFGRLSKGGIGYGDALIFFVLSFYLSGSGNLYILFFSLLPAACFSVILLMRKYSGKTKLPFAPFILCGFLIFTFTGGGL